MRLTALALLLLATGCQCNKGGPDGGREIEVVRFRALIHEGGRDEVPFDLVDSDLSALVTDDAGLRVVYPEITGAGAATFREMPPGPFVLSVNGYNLITNEERIDLGVAGLGRSGSALSDGGAVRLDLDVSGLQPWQAYSDVLQLSAVNAGYVAVNAQSYVGEQPDSGVTQALFPLAYWAACNTLQGGLVPLIDADAGDRALLTQLASMPVGDGGLLDLRTLVRAAELPAFTMRDNAATQATVTLAPVTTQEHVTLDFRQASFDALRTAVHPQAHAISSTVTVTAVPFTADEGAYTAAPDLAVLRPQQQSSDVALTFDTGNPFPASWPKIVTVRYAMQVDFAYPDGGMRALNTVMVTQDLLPAAMAGPLRPRVSPPRNVKVDGADGMTRAQIKRRPVLSWDAPETGTPTSYGVTLFHFSRVGSGPIIALAEEAFFETTERTLSVPFGEVVPGEEYVFGVTAFDAPGANVARTPFKGGFPFGAATALTTMLRIDPTLMP